MITDEWSLCLSLLPLRVCDPVSHVLSLVVVVVVVLFVAFAKSFQYIPSTILSCKVIGKDIRVNNGNLELINIGPNNKG